MTEKKYVAPPNNNGSKDAVSRTKGIYSYLHPDYWKRKLVHLIIVMPICYFVYEVFISSAFNLAITDTIVEVLTWILTLVAAFFYPFSLFWYKGSFMGRLLNNMYHIGGFFQIIGRILLTIIGGILIAGILSPIMGPLTYRKCVKKDWIIGDEKDFQ